MYIGLFWLVSTGAYQSFLSEIFFIPPTFEKVLILVGAPPGFFQLTEPWLCIGVNRKKRYYTYTTKNNAPFLRKSSSTY